MYASTFEQMRQYYATEEKKAIRKNAMRVGVVLLVAVGMQFAVLFLDILCGLLASNFQQTALTTIAQEQGMMSYMTLTLAEYVIYMGVPVIVGWFLFRKQPFSIAPCQKTDGSLGVALVLLGFGMMVIANMVGSYVLVMLEGIGISPLDIPDTQDGTVPVLLMNILTVGVMAGVLEELLFRGVVLQGLRKAGDTVALVISALMFGLMHGTIYQIPFAFILGLVFGYIVLKTGNILWTILLHTLNNTLSVLMEYWLWNMADEQANKWYLLFFAVEAVLGVIGAAVLMLRSRSRVEPVGDRVSSWLTLKQRRRACYSAATVIVFIVLMGLITLMNVQCSWLPSLSDLTGGDADASTHVEGEQQSAAVFAEVLR